MKTALLGLIILGALDFAVTPAAADCKCRANGKLFHHGEVACLSLPTGQQLARCDMVLNNSSWQKVQDGCPEAAAQSPAAASPPEPHAQPPVLPIDPAAL
ncbi:hypothetical protein [Arvimicrobium flavum]|uniref:hypothetical protein n=1 Tax=Arvimicrobium flavum TaxID=3393320 RepID=UPI00237B61C2|nr:hypothetical protein [Mesorhizobium shangrilense]